MAVLQQKPWSERCAQCKWRSRLMMLQLSCTSNAAISAQTAMQPCSLAALQSCSHAAMQPWQPCSHTALQPCSHAALQPCSHAALQSCSHAALCSRAALCSHAAVQPCAAMQPCSLAAMQPCSLAACQLQRCSCAILRPNSSATSVTILAAPGNSLAALRPYRLAVPMTSLKT